MTIGLWALICVVCFVITFLSTRERIKPLVQEKVSVRQSFGTLGKLGPWIAMFIVTLATSRRTPCATARSSISSSTT